MHGNRSDPFDLAKFLIEINGINGAIKIARANGWHAVLSQCLVLEPALESKTTGRASVHSGRLVSAVAEQG